MMMLSKLKNMTAVVLALGFFTVSGGGVAYQVASREHTSDKPGQSALIEVGGKGGQTAEKELRQVTEKLERVQAEQEAIKSRVAILEQEFKKQAHEESHRKGKKQSKQRRAP